MPLAALEAPAQGKTTRTKTGWIISERTDLLWFTLGGAASAYALWALWRFTHVPLLLLVAVWAIVFDETHGFATISRTYFDSRWAAYVACAALYALVFDVVPRFVLKQQFSLMPINMRNQVIFSFFAAPGLLHYWLDGHIWKVGSDPDLRTYLRL
jgi:hypothetical protein